MLPQTGSLRHWVCGCSVALVFPVASVLAATPPKSTSAPTCAASHRPALLHIQPAAVTSAVVPANCVRSEPSETVDWEQDEIELTANSIVLEMDIRRLDDLLEPTTAQPLPADAQAWLKRWELTSQQQPRLSERDRTWIERMNANRVSPLARSIAFAFLERVQVADLERRFAWTIDEVTGESCVLQAVPRDETERLFLPALRVSLDPQNCAVIHMAVAGRDQNWQAITLQDQPPARLTTVTIPVAAIPPSPAAQPSAAPLIRFAADTIEIELR